MSDYLLELSDNLVARNVIKGLGLPVPMPEPLERDSDPYGGLPLEGRRIAYHASPESSLLHPMVGVLLALGADVGVPGKVAELEGLSETADSQPGELFETTVDGDARGEFYGLVLDATTAERPSDLDRLYDFFHPRLRSMTRCGRALVIGRAPAEADDPERAAAWRGLEGFTRSLAKEIGRYGSTANLLSVERGAEGRLSGPLAFFLSPRSAYVSAQPICVSVGGGMHPERGRDRRMLQGKAALVTGAAHGIGRETASQLSREGAEILCVDLPGSEALAEVESEFAGHPRPLDITDDDAPERIADWAGEFDGLDIVVHNAGVTNDRTLANMARDAWRQTLSVNVEAPLRVTDRLLEDDLINDWGRIICMSSIAGVAGNVGQTNYATSKAGLIGFTRHYARELRERGITVNALAPGFIETRMTDEMPAIVREAARRLNALSQGGQPEDVANTIRFLTTPGAQGITGQVVRVCGGALAGA